MLEFRRENSAVFLTPDVINGIGDIECAADVRYGRPQLGLLEVKDILLMGES